MVISISPFKRKKYFLRGCVKTKMFYHFVIPIVKDLNENVFQRGLEVITD